MSWLVGPWEGYGRQCASLQLKSSASCASAENLFQRRGQVRSVLGRRGRQRAGGSGDSQPTAPDRADQESTAPRLIQPLGARSYKREQLLMEHTMDLQGPSPSRCPAGGYVCWASGAKHRNEQPLAMVGGTRTRGLCGPFAADRGQR